MSYTQPIQDGRYRIQYLPRHRTVTETENSLTAAKTSSATKSAPNEYAPTCANTTESHSTTAPFTAACAKTKAMAALCGNTSE